MANHSNIGASSASRWMACPGSVRLSLQAPPAEESIYAKQGTAAHWVIERYFEAVEKDGLKDAPSVSVWDWLGHEAPNGCVLTEDDIEAVEKFVNIIEAELRSGKKYILLSEANFDLSTIYPDLRGTADIVLVETNMKSLKVFDYKHGSGTPVQVEENKQLMYYGLGAIDYVCKKFEIDYLSIMGWGSTFKEVEIAIVQPRCRHVDGIDRRWTVPAKTLNTFAVDLKAAAAATTKKDAPFKVGEHCKWCRALPICKAFQEGTFAMAKADFKGVSAPANLKLPAPEALSKDELAKVLRFADVISDWLKAVESHAQYVMEHGEVMPGWKLVQKKTNRQWTDEDAAKETLTLYVKDEDMYEKKFLSPAKAEKLLGKSQKKVVEDLCFKPEGDVTVAPEHDPREAVKGSAQTDFAALE